MLGLYIHVPFCASRCGYCDFNTYTPRELGGLNPSSYVDAATTEIELAAKMLGRATSVRTIFFGGGTPTLLPPKDLIRLLDAIRWHFDVAPDAEITTEANPESVDPRYLEALRSGGFTRLSLGVQSVRQHVLASLDRRHTPGRALAAAREAHTAGFEHINCDLIYGAAGETDDDWKASLDAVCEAPIDHVSAYSLIVEQGTALARRIARGHITAPEDDVLAERYVIADERLGAAGFEWYEVSNWARSDAAQCRHNLLYWRGGNWWGIGPGAHSHIDGVRWWNVKHPAKYAAAMTELSETGYRAIVNGNEDPLTVQTAWTSAPVVDGHEILDAATRHVEDVMLQLRLAEGMDLETLSEDERGAAKKAVGDGLLDSAKFHTGRAVLTQRGRLLADAVIREIALP